MVVEEREARELVEISRAVLEAASFLKNGAHAQRPKLSVLCLVHNQVPAQCCATNRPSAGAGTGTRESGVVGISVMGSPKGFLCSL